MQKVDFYILEGSKQRAMLFVCELTQTYFQEKKPIYIYTDSQNTAELLDNLLWTYRDDSFLPHGMDEDNRSLPIRIGYGDIAAHHHGLLINLHPEIPPQFQQFNHIIEIVFSDPLVQQLARNRYKQYREKGIELTTHKQK
jgi:DNA polymerase-3 subunit chi